MKWILLLSGGTSLIQIEMICPVAILSAPTKVIHLRCSLCVVSFLLHLIFESQKLLLSLFTSDFNLVAIKVAVSTKRRYKNTFFNMTTYQNIRISYNLGTVYSFLLGWFFVQNKNEKQQYLYSWVLPYNK